MLQSLIIFFLSLSKEISLKEVTIVTEEEFLRIDIFLSLSKEISLKEEREESSGSRDNGILSISF